MHKYLKCKEDIVYMNTSERFKLLDWIDSHKSYLNDTQSIINPDQFIDSIYEWSSTVRDPQISDRQVNVLISWYNNIVSRQLVNSIISQTKLLDEKNEKFYNQYCDDILVNCINKGYSPSNKQFRVLIQAESQIQYAKSKAALI
jgi:hypothetical protein